MWGEGGLLDIFWKYFFSDGWFGYSSFWVITIYLNYGETGRKKLKFSARAISTQFIRGLYKALGSYYRLIIVQCCNSPHGVDQLNFIQLAISNSAKIERVNN